MPEGGNVITSPAPLVGYQPPWVEPGQVKLEDVSKGFISAFALGLQNNIKRQDLERKLGMLSLANEKLEMQDRWKQQGFDLMKDKMELQSTLAGARLGMAQDRLGLAYDAMNLNQKKFDLDTLMKEDKLQTSQAAITGAEDYYKAVSSITAPEGTNDWYRQFNQVNLDHANSIATSPAAQHARAQYQRAYDSARKGIADNDKSIVKGFNDMLAQFNRGSPGINKFNMNDFNWGDNMWGRGTREEGDGTKTPMRWLAHTTDPDGKIIVLNPQQEKELIKQGEGDRISYRSMDEDSYNHFRASERAVRQIQRRQIGQRPGPESPSAQYVPDKIYTDAQGNKARYNADGSWTPL